MPVVRVEEHNRPRKDPTSARNNNITDVKEELALICGSRQS